MQFDLCNEKIFSNFADDFIGKSGQNGVFLHGKSGQNDVFLHGKSGQNIFNSMINRKLDNIIANHYAQQSTALLLSGARQVGKSYAIRKYGQ